jgi:HAE1 family hydrophobic/amphiphilic exporter-1
MHKITEFVLRIPVTTFLAVLSLVFFGFMSLVNQKMELMSSIDMPMMIITTVYPGASPEDVDKLITGPIEDAVSILSHVKDVQSTSSENMGMTLVQYEYGTDIDQAYDDLKKKMDSVKSSLPKEAEAPNYLSMNINEQPCITLSINNPMQDNLYNYVQNDIVPELEKVSGVASVSSSGGQKQYIKVELIPEKLKQYKLSMQTIAQTV